MNLQKFLCGLVFAMLLVLGFSPKVQAQDAYRISAPVTHKNLQFF